MATLPPPPVNDTPGSFAWLEWYRQLRNYVSTSGSVPWYIINFSGSNITDLASRQHRDLQGVQGGGAGEQYHLTATQVGNLLTTQQHAAISNSLELVDFTSSIAIPNTPTILKPTTTEVSNGITYNSTTGEIVFTNGGSYAFTLLLNAQTSASNKRVYFYAEIDSGGGYQIRRQSARSLFLTSTSTDQQYVLASSNYFSAGTKLKLYLWADSTTVTVNSVDIPGTTPGTVTIPAIRLMFAGSL